MRHALPHRRRRLALGSQHGVAKRGSDGRAHRMVGATGDVTEAKRHERELQSAKRAASLHPRRDASPSEDEERYALALESINENLYDWNIETGELYFSPGLRVMLGMTPEEQATLENWAALIHPDDRALHQGTLLAHFKGEIPRFECEFRYRTVDGNWRWARQHGIALRRANGRAYRMVGATGDITASRAARARVPQRQGRSRGRATRRGAHPRGDAHHPRQHE